MKSGDKYIIEIGQVMKDANGKEYAKIKGFHTLIFDNQGLDKLKKVSDIHLNDLAEFSVESGRQEAWTLAQRVAETTSTDIISAGIKFNPNYDDEYEISCSAILENDFETVKKKFEEFDLKEREERMASESFIEDLLIDVRENNSEEFNKFFIEALVDAYKRLKEKEDG